MKLKFRKKKLKNLSNDIKVMQKDMTPQVVGGLNQDRTATYTCLTEVPVTKKETDICTNWRCSDLTIC